MRLALILFVLPAFAAEFEPTNNTMMNAAMTDSACGDTIYLPAAGISGAFTLPGKGDCSANPIVITGPKGETRFPVAGQRVTPAYAGILGKLIGNSSSPVLTISGGSSPVNGLIIRNVEFAQTTSTTVLIQVGCAERSSTCKATTNSPSNITFDRVLIRTGRLGSSRRTILMNSGTGTITNSWIEQDCNESTDSQAIAVYGGHGPLMITNNYLSGMTEVIGIGGSAIVYTSISDLIPRWGQRYATATANPTVKVWGNHITHGGGYSLLQAWTSSTDIPLGKVITPSTPNGHYYQAQNYGNTGGSEPSWCTSAGCETVSNGITWKERSNYHWVKNFVENKDGALDVRWNFFDRGYGNPDQGYVMTAGARLSDTSAAARVAGNMLAHNYGVNVPGILNTVHSPDPSDWNAFPTIVSTLYGPYNIGASNKVLRMSIDGGTPFDITLTEGAARTATQVVTEINEAILAQGSVSISGTSDSGWNGYEHTACFTTATAHGFPNCMVGHYTAGGQMPWGNAVYIKNLAGGNWASLTNSDLYSASDSTHFCASVPVNLTSIGTQTGTPLSVSTKGAAKVFTDSSAHDYVQVSGANCAVIPGTPSGGAVAPSKIEFQAVSNSAYATLGLPQSVIYAGTHPITQAFYHWAVNSNMRVRGNLFVNVDQSPWTQNASYKYLFGIGSGWDGFDVSNNTIVAPVSGSKAFYGSVADMWMPPSNVTTRSNIFGYTANPSYYWTDGHMANQTLINYYGATYTYVPASPVDCTTDSRVAAAKAMGFNWLPYMTTAAASDPYDTSPGCSGGPDGLGIYKVPPSTVSSNWSTSWFKDTTYYEPTNASLVHKGHNGKDIGADISQIPFIRNLTVTISDRAAIFDFDLSHPAAQYPVSIRVCTTDPELNPTCANVADLNPATYNQPDYSDNDRFPQTGAHRTIIVGQNSALTAATTYYYWLEGGGASQRGTFTTSATLAGTTALAFSYTPDVTGTATLAIDYGTTYSRSGGTITGSTGTVACTSGSSCTVSASGLTKGAPVYARARYLNGGGSTIWTGPVVVSLPQ